MTKKRRDEEDFRELGAYILVAREALLKAQVKALNMYRQDAPQAKEISALLAAVDGRRMQIDGAWIHDVTEHAVPGPDPIFGTQYEALELAREGLARVRPEAEEMRRTSLIGPGAA